MRRKVMRRRLVVLAAAVLALVAGGCGSESVDDATPGAPGSGSPSTAPQTSVESVSLQQSGGIAGVHRTWRVTSSTPGAKQVFAAAQAESLQDAAAREPTPICCDFFVYNIVIHYSDGDTLQVATSDGEKPDPAVKALMSAILATNPAPPDEATPR